MKKLLLLVALLTSLGVGEMFAADPTFVRFATNLGNIDVELLPEYAPNTVANFYSYVDSGAYNGSFIHRSIPGFIIQGGGYTYPNKKVATIPTHGSVVNEFYFSNIRGTIAMAKLGNDPNSATDEWYFNLIDNSANLDNQNGGFTVFGRVINDSSLAVMDAIAALATYNETSQNPALTDLPLINYTGSTDLTKFLVDVTSITRLSAPDFFAGEVSVGSGVFYLSFPSGNPFGYYAYLSDVGYIYHFDMGYEYVFQANDGASGVYLYDFMSQHFWYTSPSFPFPYLYDFNLNAPLYYFPDPDHPGRYNTNGVRYFSNLNTGEIFTQ